MIKLKEDKRRVVVTGLGVVSSIGIGWPDFWKNLLAGQSGISKITSFDVSGYERQYGGEVKNFDPLKFMTKKRAQTIGRSSQFAIAAVKLAIDDAKLVITDQMRERMSVFIGMTMAEMGVLENFNDVSIAKKEKSVIRAFPSVFPAGSVSVNVARDLKLKGFARSFSTACAAGNYSIGNAYDLIKNGKIDYALAGGADSFSRVVFTGFGRLFAIASKRCQPFDKNREGMIPGEGAGIVLLETLESAQKRKAPIYAEILGYGLSCDAKHMTDPSPLTVAKAMRKALKESNVKSSEIDYISAHGTGTKNNDKAESEAVHEVFSSSATKIPVSSIKSMLGHTMGAASAIETLACCLAIKYNEVPPTINYVEEDPECNIDCVPNQSRSHEVNTVLNNSQAFGGNNACVVLKRVK